MDGSGQVFVEWFDESAAAASDVTSAEELQWLRLEPGQTTLDVKYQLRRGATWPDSVLIHADQTCELLAESGDGSLCTVQRLPTGRHSITARLTPAALSEPREIYLRFHVWHAASIGRLRVPRVELASMPVENAWLAVSADSSLECVPSIEAGHSTQPATDFAAAWGIAEGVAVPQFVLVLDEAAFDSRLVVRPRKLASEHSERLHVDAGKKQFRVVYQADVVPQGRHCFGWSISVPSDLSIDVVSVERKSSSDSTAERSEIPVRWTRPSPNRIHVFLGDSVAGRYQLKLAGFVPIAGFGTYSMPRVFAVDVPPTNQFLSVYRDADVFAQIEPKSQAVIPDSMPTAPPPAGWDTRYVGSFSMDPNADDALRIVTSPNKVLLDGLTQTTLFQDGGQWFATLACRLRIGQGETDRLQFNVPATFTGPFEFRGATLDELVSPIKEQRALLTVRLPAMMRGGDVAAFEVRSPLSVPASQQVSVPRIVPAAAGIWRNYVSVPSTIESTAANWIRSGVVGADRPIDLPADLVPSGEFATYRIETDDSDVSLRPEPPSRSRSVIWLAEMTNQLGPSGEFLISNFVISPQGRSDCVLRLPGSQRLLRVALDGHPAIMRSLNSRRWWVQLGPPNLPQTLQVVTLVRASDDDRPWQISLRRPTLWQHDEPMPTELSLWSVSRLAVPARPYVVGAAIVSPEDYVAVRLDRMASVSESATQAVINSPMRDGYRWYANWSALLHIAENSARSKQSETNRLRQTPGIVEPADDLFSAAISRCTAWRRQADELFATSGAIEDIDVDFVERLESIDAAILVPPPGFERTYFVADGGAEQLDIEIVPTEWTPLAGRVAAVSSIVLLAAAVGWFFVQPWATDVCVRWRYAIGALIGLVAWACVQPSWIGLLVASASFVLWIRVLLPPPTRLNAGPSDSTVTSSR
jgi:hypothetical protein